MPPRKRGRGGVAQHVATPSRDDDAMEDSTPQNTDTPVATSAPPEKPIYNVLDSCWTSEQKAGLFSAVIRWKPSGAFTLCLRREWQIGKQERQSIANADIYRHA